MHYFGGKKREGGEGEGLIDCECGETSHFHSKEDRVILSKDRWSFHFCWRSYSQSYVRQYVYQTRNQTRLRLTAIYILWSMYIYCDCPSLNDIVLALNTAAAAEERWYAVIWRRAEQMRGAVV